MCPFSTAVLFRSKAAFFHTRSRPLSYEPVTMDLAAALLSLGLFPGFLSAVVVGA